MLFTMMMAYEMEVTITLSAVDKRDEFAQRIHCVPNSANAVIALLEPGRPLPEDIDKTAPLSTPAPNLVGHKMAISAPCLREQESMSLRCNVLELIPCACVCLQYLITSLSRITEYPARECVG